MTEPVTLTARVDMLEAALICASREETRYYLNGVYVDPAGLVVATDGHRLFAGDFTPDNSRATLPAFEGWIIPRDALRKALKAAPRRATDPASHVMQISPERVGDVVCQPVDGSYPDWRRAIPSEVTPDGKAAKFNGYYLADFDKIAAILSNARTADRLKVSCTLHPNGENPAPVTFPGRYVAGEGGRRAPAIGVIMPIRSFASASGSPDHYRAFVETFAPNWHTKQALERLKADDWKI